MSRITIRGKQLGLLGMPQKGIKEVCIIHILDEFRPQGPAENAIVCMTTKEDGSSFASYIPWVGYFDLDRENAIESDRWKLTEPAQDIEYKDVRWVPFLVEED